MMRDHVMPHKIHNYAHNNGWCAENLGFLGRIDEAISLAVNLIELPRPAKFKKLGETEYYDAGGTPFREGRNRLWALLNDYALWDELLRLSETSVLAATDDPLMQANRYRYRGMAYFYKGELEQGRGEIAALEEFLSGYETQRDEAGEAAKTKAEEKQKDEEDEKKRDEAIKKADERGAQAL